MLTIADVFVVVVVHDDKRPSIFRIRENNYTCWHCLAAHNHQPSATLSAVTPCVVDVAATFVVVVVHDDEQPACLNASKNREKSLKNREK
jgi:hypothetical protein